MTTRKPATSDAERVDPTNARRWRCAHRGIWTVVVATSKQEAQWVAWGWFSVLRDVMHPDRGRDFAGRAREVLAREATDDDVEAWLTMREQQARGAK